MSGRPRIFYHRFVPQEYNGGDYCAHVDCMMIRHCGPAGMVVVHTGGPMGAWMSKWLTTEAVFSILGGVWFVLSSFFPAIPQSMPIPAVIPGLDSITPGLLVAISLVPVVLKVVTPGQVPFVRKQVPMPDGAPPPPTGDDK